MKVKITDTDTSKWFVRFYGIGGVATVEDDVWFGGFYRPTFSEYRRIYREFNSSEPNITLLFIPVSSAECL